MNSQRLLRNLLESAMAANLEKNELRAFIALLNQTIGYGKKSDPLTMGRLAHLTGIRKDRIGKALAALVDRGIFERKTHKRFDYTYSIPDKFFEEGSKDRFFAPSIPLSGKATQPTGGENHSAGTYRDKPSTEINHNNKQSTPAPEPDLPEQLQAQDKIVVCDSILQDAKQKLEKPDAVSAEAYQNLMPALKTLPATQAMQVLQLLAMAAKEGSIKTTQQRLGGAYIKAAKAGALDTSRLEQTEKPMQTHPSQHFWRSTERKPQTDADKASRAAGLAAMEALLKSMQ